MKNGVNQIITAQRASRVADRRRSTKQTNEDSTR
jgi:hypothetical protein